MLFNNDNRQQSLIMNTKKVKQVVLLASFLTAATLAVASLCDGLSLGYTCASIPDSGM